MILPITKVTNVYFLLGWMLWRTKYFRPGIHYLCRISQTNCIMLKCIHNIITHYCGRIFPKAAFEFFNFTICFWKNSKLKLTVFPNKMVKESLVNKNSNFTTENILYVSNIKKTTCRTTIVYYWYPNIGTYLVIRYPTKKIWINLTFNVCTLRCKSIQSAERTKRSCFFQNIYERVFQFLLLVVCTHIHKRSWVV